MIVKWAIGGAIVGGVIALLGGVEPIAGIVFGAVIGAALRKWIFRTFWS